MNEKVLFVDDEPALLHGIERRLGFDHLITTATSGPEGLEAIRNEGPFAVVITDMRMPKMDGIEFLDLAREVAPDSVFMMLTGNQDQATAVRALNEGHVFRFLTKPCDGEELSRAIEAGLRQHQLLTTEKELLNKTFVGSVRVLTDVIEILQPEGVARGEAIERRVELLRGALGVAERWEYKLAARLSPIGLALLSEEERLTLGRSEHSSEAAMRLVARGAETTSRLVRSIPRLAGVAAICAPDEPPIGEISTLEPTSSGAIKQVGSTLLRAATLWESLTRQGLSNLEIAEEIAIAMPQLPPAATRAIEHDQSEEPMEGAVRMTLSDLEEGMVVAADVTASDGSILLRRGRRLSDAVIAKLRGVTDLRPVFITKSTAASRREPREAVLA